MNTCVIPLYGTVTSCAMCMAPVSEYTGVEFHPHVSSYFTPDMTCRALVIELITRQEDLPEGCDDWETFVGEHLCRKCRRCGYGWVERPLVKHDAVYTPAEDKEDHGDDSPEAG